MSSKVDMFEIYFGSFCGTAFERIRKETYGQDIGQFCWITADEYRTFLSWLELQSDDHVLDIASGSGGPAVFVARETGARVVGIDLNAEAVATARKIAEREGFQSRTQFRQVDARDGLPFADGEFQAVVCIDSIQNIGNRPALLSESFRVLQPGGRILYTDTHLITGVITISEIAPRVHIQMHFDFTPPGENERLLAAAGFELQVSQDATENMAQVSKRMRDARARYREGVLRIETEGEFDATQRFLWNMHLLASERRLSRYVFVARKPGRQGERSGVHP